MKRILFFCLFTTGWAHFVFAQNAIKIEPLVPGQPCPPIQLTEIRNYPKNSASLEDFRGKWLVLDFWDQYCGSCVASFPKTNALQKKFAGQVKFVLVGQSDHKYGNRVREVYEKYREKQHLDLTAAFDSTLWRRFDISADPFIAIIDPDGIVRVLTTVIDSVNVNNLISGKEYHFEPAFTGTQREAKAGKLILLAPYLFNGNGGADTDYIFRSILAPWNINTMRTGVAPISTYLNETPGLFQEAGLGLRELYDLAYFGQIDVLPGDSGYGKYSSFPDVEIANKDTVHFFDFLNALDIAHTWDTPKAFIYSLSYPKRKASEAFIREALKHDLKTYFGFDAHIERRKRPVWRLIATEKASQNKTKGKPLAGTAPSTRSHFIANNVPALKLARLCAAYHQPYGKDDPLFIDDTHLGYNIDIDIEGALADFGDYLKAIREIGFDFVKGEQEMDVLVIRDPK